MPAVNAAPPPPLLVQAPSPPARLPWIGAAAAAAAFFAVIVLALATQHKSPPLAPARGPGTAAQPGLPSLSGPPQAQGTSTARVSGSTAENQALRATLPAGWKVTDSDDQSMTIDPPGEPIGQVYLASAPASTPATADAGLDKYIHAVINAGAFQDGKSCVARTKRSIGGVDGVMEGVCYKVPAQQGGSFSVMELIWYGASKDQRLYYELDRYVYEPERAQDFIDASTPIERSVQWKYR